MMPGVNKRQMQQMMRKMGIQQKEIDASEVIIRCSDREILITSPSVARVNMMGQDTWQITGNAVEKALDTKPEISQDDIKTVMNQASVSEDKAAAAIEEAEGDLAQAIMSLQGN